jgi:hypothetical protein
MPDAWNAEIYRRRAEQWQKAAEDHPEEREACLATAEKYAHLASLIKKNLSRA